MTPPEPPPTDKANNYHAYFQGWRDGAACRAMKEEAACHSNKAIADAYAAGYSDGRAARQVACAAASKRYGYGPSILRVQS